MKKINVKKIILLFLFTFFFASNKVIFADLTLDLVSKDNHNISNKEKKKQESYKAATSEIEAPTATAVPDASTSYQPYVQFGGTRFFHVTESNAATTVDLFVPIWQHNLTDLVFTDLRLNDRTGTPFEGNIHLGYRHLIPESQQMFGFYGAFDRKKTKYSNYFNQIMFGGEYWIKNWFLGANYYQPVGDTTKLVSAKTEIDIDKLVWVTKDLKNEKAMTGVDAEVGYEFKQGLVGYVGGYYFAASNTSTITGPRARLTYDWSLENGRRILGIFDKVGLETGVQNDKPRGTTWYISANARIGWLFDRKAVLEGVSRHMIDPVRRDIDVVSNDSGNREKGTVTDETGKQLEIQRVRNNEEFVAAINATNVDVIVVEHEINDSNDLKRNLTSNNGAANKKAIFAVDQLNFTDISNVTGHQYFYNGNSRVDGTLLISSSGGRITKNMGDILYGLGHRVKATYTTESASDKVRKVKNRAASASVYFNGPTPTPRSTV